MRDRKPPSWPVLRASMLSAAWDGAPREALIDRAFAAGVDQIERHDEALTQLSDENVRLNALVRRYETVAEAAQALQDSLNEVLDALPPEWESLPFRRKALNALIAYSAALAEPKEKT